MDLKNISSEETSLHKEVSSSALRFSFGTLLSRFSGFFREIFMAFFFGTSALISSFLVAYRLAYALRRLLGEGALLVGFIPHFETFRSQNPKLAASFFRDVYFSLGFFLILFTGLVDLVLWFCLKNFSFSPHTREIFYLIFFILPGLLFICLSALSGALLQCEKKFFLSGLSPLIFNFSWIFFVFFFSYFHLTSLLMGLALGTIFSFFLQWAFFIPDTFRFLKRFFSMQEFFQIQLFSPELKKMIKTVSLGIVGIGASQINSVLDMLFAKISSLEGPAYLSYANRLYQFPFALLSISLATALLPLLAKEIQIFSSEKIKNLLHFSLSKAFTLLLPCTLAFWVLGISSVSLLFYRGQFLASSAFHTTFCLWGFAFGLVPATFSLILSQFFYARKDFYTPMKAAVCAISSNALVNCLGILLFHWETASIAWVTSFASVLNFYLLNRALKKQLPNLFSEKLLFFFLKVTLCGVCASSFTLLAGLFLFNDPTLPILFFGKNLKLFSSLPWQLLHFSFLSLFFSGLFFLFAKLFQVKEILAILDFRSLRFLPKKEIS